MKQNLKITLDTEQQLSSVVDTAQTTNKNNNIITTSDNSSFVHINNNSSTGSSSTTTTTTTSNNIYHPTINNKNLTSKLHLAAGVDVNTVDDNENLSLRIYLLLLIYGICAGIYSSMYILL